MAARGGNGRVVDAFVEGEPVRRGVRAEPGADSLSLGGRPLPYASVFWISRRAGLLLLFGREFTAALKGNSEDLEELGRAVERGSGREGDRRRLLRPFAREVVVCTAGTAVSGVLEGREVHGLHLAVFTQRGLHLLSRDRRHTMRWPVERAEREGEGGRDRETLLLAGGGNALRLRYLFPEEVRAALRVARRTPEGGGEAALEMFARGEVAPPVAARLPELTVSVQTLQRAAVEAAARMPEEAVRRAGLEPAFFELHLQELAEIALGPLMLRKSAAQATPGLERALDVMDSEALRQDTEAGVTAAADRLCAVYARELERALRERRRAEPRLAIGERERRGLATRLLVPFREPARQLERLQAAGDELRGRVEELEGGPPEGGTEEVEEARTEWSAILRRVDRAYGEACAELLDEISRFWTGALLPRLERAHTLPPRAPEWVRLGVAAAGILAVAAALLLLL